MLALLIVALFGAVLAADVYRRVKYPDVLRHEADVFFDIGMSFLLSFGGLATGLGGLWFRLNKRRTLANIPESRHRSRPQRKPY